MAFHFPLEAVLRLRRGQERMERLKLEAIASEQARVRAQLESLTQQFIESRRLFLQQMGQEKLGSELQFEDARTELVAAAQRSLKQRILQLEQQRLKQIEAYTKAHRDREVLDKLRERKFEVYRQELSRHEQQQLDDLFLMRLGLLRDE